jgi:Tubulin/FtsZ family, GTPase domain
MLSYSSTNMIDPSTNMINHQFNYVKFDVRFNKYVPMQQQQIQPLIHSKVTTTIAFALVLCLSNWDICTVSASYTSPSIVPSASFISKTSPLTTAFQSTTNNARSRRRIPTAFLHDMNDLFLPTSRSVTSNFFVEHITQQKKTRQLQSVLFSSTLKTSKASFALFRSTKRNGNNDDNNNSDDTNDDNVVIKTLTDSPTSTSASIVNGEYETYGSDNSINNRKRIDFNGKAPETSPCVIKVIGVGGGGGNAVNHMIEENISGVAQFWAVNTDTQALTNNLAPNKLNIGKLSTRGLGAGGIPHEGSRAALENINDIKQICSNTDMVFITAGM